MLQLLPGLIVKPDATGPEREGREVHGVGACICALPISADPAEFVTVTVACLESSADRAWEKLTVPERS